jgi:hypothetical protein
MDTKHLSTTHRRRECDGYPKALSQISLSG